MRLLKYLGKHLGAVALVFMLLIGQAFCDLMLPNYTAKIVDVGIQQSGIEHASPDELSVETYEGIAALLPADELSTFEESYAPGGEGVYALTDAGASNRETLDDLVALPLAQTLGMAQSGMSDNLSEQVGIAAASAEYASLGFDLGAMQMDYLLLTALKMMGFVALSALISVCLGFVASRTGAKIGRELREKLFSRVMMFSDAEVQRFSAASLITRGTNDIQQIQMMTIMLLRMVLFAPILAIGGIIMIMRMDISMGWVIGVAVAALIVVVLTLMMIAMPKFRIMQKLIDNVNLISREMLTGVQVVRAFGQQEHEQERFDEASTKLMRTQLFTNRVMTFMMPLMTVIMNLVSVVIVWLGAGQIDAGVIQPGDLIAFITYSMMIIMGFLMLSMLAVIAPRADVAAKRVDEVIEADLSIVDPMPSGSSASGTVEEPAALVGAGETPVGEGVGVDQQGFPAPGSALPGAEVQFDHVSFRYDDQSECVLNDVTFTAEAGKTCAIIGSTGSGKSTILKLIERFYDVSEGAVRIDGVDVRAIPLQDLRVQFGYVPQRAFLFTGTVDSNVGFGGEYIDETRIREALDIAQAAEFVESLDGGVEAEITQGGTNVSGGQRQRLAIARALATDARALLFDDSFSALDYKTDAALRKALAERVSGKTQIIVAQRIATVMHADKIIVLDEGRIVGQGMHGELLRSCDQYREIAYSQLAPEEVERAMSGNPSSGSMGGEA